MIIKQRQLHKKGKQQTATKKCKATKKVIKKSTTLHTNKAHLTTLLNTNNVLRHYSKHTHNVSYLINKKSFSTNNNNNDNNTDNNNNNDSFFHFNQPAHAFPVSDNIDKYRDIAPPRSPLENMGIHIPQSLKQTSFGQSFDEMQAKQKGNYTMPSPFEEDLVASSQKVQQEFHSKQHVDAFQDNKVITKDLTDVLSQSLPSTPVTSKSLSTSEYSGAQKKSPEQPLAQDKFKHQAKKAKNVGNVGKIEELAEFHEEQTFSRTIFYGFAPGAIVMNGMAFQGSVLATPGAVFCWKPQRWEEVTAEAISILQFLWPSPDLVLFGCGPKALPIDPSAHHYLRTLNIPYDVLSSHAAMGTFNLMNEEYRRVVVFNLGYDYVGQFDKELIKHVQHTRQTHGPLDEASGSGSNNNKMAQFQEIAPFLKKQ